MGGILGLLLKSDLVREFVAVVAAKVIAALLHKRSTDPEFRAQLQFVFDQMTKAVTEEERINASKALFNLDRAP